MIVYFCDLDDTLFSSRGKHRTGEELEPAAFFKTGEPVSYSNASQRLLLSSFHADHSRFIPVTARSVEALSRTTISVFDHAICSNGSVILNRDRSVDQAWSARMRSKIGSSQEQLKQFEKYNEQWAKRNDLRQWVVEAEDLGPAYYVVKSNTSDLSHLEQKALELKKLANTSARWIGTIHLNGNNLAVIPKGVSKADAVEFLIARLSDEQPIMTIGVGDSKSDWRFMSKCDFAMMPTKGQLADSVSLSLQDIDLC